MSDIIREVDEELRRERYQKIWERYGAYLVIAAILVVLAVAGWRAWDWYQTREAEKAGARFEAILKLLNDGRRFEAEADLNTLAKDAPSGYRLLALFRAAAEAGKTDPAAGVAAYDAIADDASIEPLLRDLARVHASLLLLDTASVTEIARRMEPLLSPLSAFRHSAREILALARYKSGEHQAAEKLFTELLTDPSTPPSMRTRAEVIRTLLTDAAAASPAASGPATQ